MQRIPSGNNQWLVLKVRIDIFKVFFLKIIATTFNYTRFPGSQNKTNMNKQSVFRPIKETHL